MAKKNALLDGSVSPISRLRLTLILNAIKWLYKMSKGTSMTNKIEDYVDLVVEAAGYEELMDYARAYLRLQAQDLALDLVGSRAAGAAAGERDQGDQEGDEEAAET